MTRKPTLADALKLAEGLDATGPDYRTVRELQDALRELSKDQEATA